MAGGNPVEVFNAGAYNRAVNAKRGDLGSRVLKPRPSGTVWKRSGIGVTRWQMTARHGGGYQFRLCPAGALLTEAATATSSLPTSTRTWSASTTRRATCPSRRFSSPTGRQGGCAAGAERR